MWEFLRLFCLRADIKFAFPAVTGIISSDIPSKSSLGGEASSCFHSLMSKQANVTLNQNLRIAATGMKVNNGLFNLWLNWHRKSFGTLLKISSQNELFIYRSL